MPIKGVLLDLGGVVYVGETALPGAVAAVERLRAAGIPFRGLTNTTRQPRRLLLDKLRRLGLDLAPENLFMPAIAARAHLEVRGLAPHLLVHPALEEDFAGLPETEPKAVVIGDAAEGFTYAALNRAFRALEAGAEFLALARNRSFRDADGDLSLDAGPFVAALEYATGRQATVLGKPSPDFFAAALASLGCAPAEAAMVGDDVESDIGGAQTAGIPGILVRTGKYQPGDEATVDPPAAAVAADLAAAVGWILRDDFA
ncbi:MAG: TIGR01458 family HAD-type hydrolase [Inquilinus sp.]|nr:TIGR01458 family HAD-type hydrolase [Inquilinus sp.]